MLKLSVSSVDEWLTCRRKWELSHVERWEPWVRGAGVVSGVLFHKWVARVLVGEMDFGMDDEELLRCEDPGLARARARAGLRVWRNEVPGGVVQVEREFRIKREGVGVEWRGRVDALVRDGGELYVVDHKLVSVPKWDWFQHISDQLVQYAVFMRWEGLEVVGGYWDVVVVPALRKRVKEGLDEFEERLVEESQARGGVVVLPVTWTEEDLGVAEEKILMVEEEVVRGKVFRNPSVCWRGCPYMLICRDSSRASELGYVKREEVLDGEGEAGEG